MILRALFLPLALLLAVAPAAAQGHAHQHGLARLDIAVEPGRLTLTLDAPQEVLVGHERLPRNAAERQAADALLARLRDGQRLWALPAALQCRLAELRLEAPLLEPAAKAAAAAEHADVEAEWRFDCAGPLAGLRQLDLGPLLDALPRLRQLNAQIVDARGQHQATLKRPARQLAWGR
ncbi:MAG: DUF2796 domain-containing protein [Burkholderiaceae bacterium]|nr:DUF2796 domain-containing protein [Burkholderiaceae bacterium]